MELSIINIGNSRGIRIPKSWITQLGFGDKVEAKTENNSLILSRPKKLRDGWTEQFKLSGAPHLDPEFEDWQNMTNEFDKTEPPW
jgi:antitoxin MazE